MTQSYAMVAGRGSVIAAKAPALPPTIVPVTAAEMAVVESVAITHGRPMDVVVFDKTIMVPMLTPTV